MKRVGRRLAVLVLLIAALIASMPPLVPAPSAVAADAGGQGSGHVHAAPLDEAARSVGWLDPYWALAIRNVPER